MALSVQWQQIPDKNLLALQLVRKACLGETARRNVITSKAARGWPSVCLILMAVPVLLDGVVFSVAQVCPLQSLSPNSMALLDTKVINEMGRWGKLTFLERHKMQVYGVCSTEPKKLCASFPLAFHVTFGSKKTNLV